MSTIRIFRKLESTTLHLPELASLIGKTVEFTVREESETASPLREAGWVNPLRGSVLRDDDPFEPAVPPNEWEAAR